MKINSKEAETLLLIIRASKQLLKCPEIERCSNLYAETVQIVSNLHICLEFAKNQKLEDKLNKIGLEG